MDCFSGLGTETSRIPWKNPKRVRREEEAGGIEKQPGKRGVREGAEEEDKQWARENERFEGESEAVVLH